MCDAEVLGGNVVLTVGLRACTSGSFRRRGSVLVHGLSTSSLIFAKALLIRVTVIGTLDEGAVIFGGSFFGSGSFCCTLYPLLADACLGRKAVWAIPSETS